MDVVDGVVGNVDEDATLAAVLERHEARGTVERAVLDDAMRRRSRFRTTTDAGRELGVVLDGRTPRPGDVLLETDDAIVVVAFASVPAAAVDVGDDADPAGLVAFGHDVGNRHRPMAVREGTVYVALERGTTAEAGDDLRSVDPRLADVVPPTAEATVERVDPSLFDDSVAGHSHDHPDDHPHDHSHEDHAHD
jgi:urease accessory protein